MSALLHHEIAPLAEDRYCFQEILERESRQEHIGPTIPELLEANTLDVLGEVCYFEEPAPKRLCSKLQGTSDLVPCARVGALDIE